MGSVDYIALQISWSAEYFVHNGGSCRALGRWPSEPDVVLNCGDFQVWRGEVFGVLGARGAGKSALVRCIAERLLVDEGYITLFCDDVLQDKMAVKRLINRVLAEASLFQKLTPLENLVYGARIYSLEAHETEACALKVLGQIGLGQKAISRPVGELSADVQRKVAVACAALSRPALLLLDEPMERETIRSRQAIQDFIEELRSIYNATILLTTSDVGMTETLCDRVAILDKRRVVAADTPARLKRRTAFTDVEDAPGGLTGEGLVQ